MTLLLLLRTLSVGYFSQHRTRSVLVILSIALGVATLVATQALNRGVKTGVQQGVNPLAGLADLLILNGDAGVDAKLADELLAAKIPGVDRAIPLVLWRAALADLDNKNVLLIGVNWSEWIKKEGKPQESDPLGIEARITNMPTTFLERAALLLEPPALVSEKLARLLHEHDPKSKRFRLRNAGEIPTVTLLGTLDFTHSPLPLKDSLVVVLDLLPASGICFPEKIGFAHQINVTVTPGANPEVVAESLRQWLDGRADVQTIEASKELVSDVTTGLEIGMTIGGAGALVVGLFLVYNVLSVSVAERRHDIGILRSVGATRPQIAGLFVGEALVMGLAGSLLGLPLGWLLAWLAIAPIANLIGDLIVAIDSARIELPLWLMGLALLGGTLVAVLAALVPAIQAAGEEPADAVRRVPRKHPFLAVFLQVGFMLLLLGGGFLLAGLRYRLPPYVGMFAGIVCILVGGLMATPLLAALVGRAIQPLFRYLLGLEGRLAADNLVRAPGRTGIVIAALAATGALMVQTSGFLKSSREAIYDWIEEKVAADLFVTSGSAVTSGGSVLNMRPGLKEELAGLPGVEAIMAVRSIRLDYLSPTDGKQHIVSVVALDATAFDKLTAERAFARNIRQIEGFRQAGNVVVSENFARLYRKKVGDTIVLRGQGRELEATIVGTAVDYTWNRGTIFLARDWFSREYGDQQVSVYNLFLEPGVEPETVRQEIGKRLGGEALVAITRPEVHKEVQSTLQKLYSVAYAQQGVVGLVSLLGVVSALFISVLQRRRELGLLRAVGATRAQILRSVLAEAVLMGLIGAMVGFGIGLLLEWYVLDIMILDESGFDFAMRIPWLEAGVVALASVLLATLAGLWPAYHATTLRIPEAIAYE